MKLQLTAALVLVLAALLHTASCCFRGQRPQQQQPQPQQPGREIHVSGSIRFNPPPPGNLPAGTEVVIQLLDISLADAPSKELAQIRVPATNIRADGSLPYQLTAVVPPDTPMYEYSVAASASCRTPSGIYFTDTAFYVPLAENTAAYSAVDVVMVRRDRDS